MVFVQGEIDHNFSLVSVRFGAHAREAASAVCLSLSFMLEQGFFTSHLTTPLRAHESATRCQAAHARNSLTTMAVRSYKPHATYYLLKRVSRHSLS
ncbi:MAG: hypothetical protein DMF64_15670 [Acidobacteria bacterium]|nr:MAG: hypothetical protein DMF64_15670 [Acidobacteriota bacterium]